LEMEAAMDKRGVAIYLTTTLRLMPNIPHSSALNFENI